MVPTVRRVGVVRFGLGHGVVRKAWIGRASLLKQQPAQHIVTKTRMRATMMETRNISEERPSFPVIWPTTSGKLLPLGGLSTSITVLASATGGNLARQMIASRANLRGSRPGPSRMMFSQNMRSLRRRSPAFAYPFLFAVFSMRRMLCRTWASSE